MKIEVFTLFPEFFEWFYTQRHIRNLKEQGSEIETINYRDYTPLSGGQVDDTPYGGGAGMVLRVDVVAEAMEKRYQVAAERVKDTRRVIVLAPGGDFLDEAKALELAQEDKLTILCGRYEGFDERIHTEIASDILSIGPYVLTGGELAAMVVMDTVLRKLPGALGDAHSALEESYSEALEGCPEYPHFTRPANWRGHQVPEILLSGDHKKIQEWRLKESRGRKK